MIYIKAVVVCVLLFAASICSLIGGLLPVFIWSVGDGSSPRASIPSEIDGGGNNVATARQILIFLYQREVTSSTGSVSTAVYADPDAINWACDAVRDQFATAIAFSTLGWIVGFVALFFTLMGPYLIAPSFMVDRLFCGHSRFLEFVGVAFTVFTNIALIIVWNLGLGLRANVQCGSVGDTTPDGNFYSGNSFRSEGYAVSTGLELQIAAWLMSLIAVFIHILTFTESFEDKDVRASMRRFK